MIIQNFYIIMNKLFHNKFKKHNFYSYSFEIDNNSKFVVCLEKKHKNNNINKLGIHIFSNKHNLSNDSYLKNVKYEYYYRYYKIKNNQTYIENIIKKSIKNIKNDILFDQYINKTIFDKKNIIDIVDNLTYYLVDNYDYIL